MTRPARTASDPLRLLLWSPGGSGEHYHGPGSFAYRLFSKARPGLYRITLVHASAQQKEYDLFAEQHRLDPPPRGPIGLWRFLRASRRWLAANADRFDVFFGLSGFHPTMAPAGWAQDLGLPAVVFLTQHRLEFVDKPGLKRWLGLPARRRALARRLAGLVAMSRAIEEELLEYQVPAERIARIPMAVDTAHFHPPADEAERRGVRAAVGWPERSTLAFVGGLTPRKQPHLLIEALASLRQSGRDCQVVFIGPEHDAAYVADMKRQAAALGLGERVIFHGFTRDPAPLLRGADLFALVSLQEGMPAALAEALASGLPAIATPISGATDLVDDGACGYLVEGRAQAVAAAWDRYLASPDLLARHQAAARLKAVRSCGIETVLAAYEALFRRAAGIAAP